MVKTGYNVEHSSIQVIYPLARILELCMVTLMEKLFVFFQSVTAIWQLQVQNSPVKHERYTYKELFFWATETHTNNINGYAVAESIWV